MTQVVAYCGSLPHFSQHLLPIWESLPESIRGPLHARGRASAYLTELGIPHLGGIPRRTELVLVASYEDLRATAPSPAILLQHGAGQTYTGDSTSADHPSYSGGRGRERVQLFLCPSESDAALCRASGALAAAVGVPKMDKHWGVVREREPGSKPVVAISFHADVFVCAESRSAFPHYRLALIDLAHQQESLPFQLIGHCHPRSFAQMSKFWKQLKVEFVPDFDEVLERADCYVIDTSSSAYEFASTDRPVLSLNAPWYRRDVHHGLRWWNAIPGHAIDEPEELMGSILLALQDPPYLAEKRRAAVQVAYTGPDGVSLIDGRATERAVNAIMELVERG